MEDQKSNYRNALESFGIFVLLVISSNIFQDLISGPSLLDHTIAVLHISAFAGLMIEKWYGLKNLSLESNVEMEKNIEKEKNNKDKINNEIKDYDHTGDLPVEVELKEGSFDPNTFVNHKVDIIKIYKDRIKIKSYDGYENTIPISSVTNFGKSEDTGTTFITTEAGGRDSGKAWIRMEFYNKEESNLMEKAIFDAKRNQEVENVNKNNEELSETEKIEKYYELLEKGVITEEEYQKKKEDIMNN